MFDLEKAIADWRRQMLAAGIKTPVPLEELEIHVRDEIELQMKSGLNLEKAFEISIWRIGQSSVLKREFGKAQANMETRCINQRFISGMVMVFSGAVLAMLFLLSVATAIHAGRFASAFKSGKISLLDLYATFSGNALLSHTDFVHECLVISLIFTVLFALLSCRLAKQTHMSRDV
jgi:uncharacterized membrane protein YhaH (DUF805 family)